MLSQRRNAPQRRSRCREGQMFQLVKLYHSHRCLWDRSHPDYKNRAKRYQAFKEIGIAIDLYSLEDVKKKIKSMRDTYTAEKNRMKKSMRASADGDEVYRTKLSWYRFADTFFNGREEKSSEISLNVTHMKDDPLSGEDEECAIIEQYDDQYPELVEMEYTLDDQSIPDESETVHQYPRKRSKPNTKSSQQQQQQDLPTINFETGQEPSEGSYAPSTYDEYHYFGLNVASQLRTLPRLNSLVLQDKINKLIFDERLQYESHTAYHQTQTENNIHV